MGTPIAFIAKWTEKALMGKIRFGVRALAGQRHRAAFYW